MKVYQRKERIYIEDVFNFDLGQTFDCGQCFRWEENNGVYSAVAFGKFIKVGKENNRIFLENSSLEDFNNIWKFYFDLETDYRLIGQSLSNLNPVLKRAYEFGSGIRILKQEPWEVVCSFIISQNNNIPRIKKIISRFCENFGEPVGDLFTFPSADRVSTLSENDLLVIRSGFRAKYIIDAAKKVSSGAIDFCALENMPLEDAIKSLKIVNGIGNKVATCVLLYALHRLDAFPIDVWMKKIMDKMFSGESPKFFGIYAGVAQQYLYHYFRANSNLLS